MEGLSMATNPLRRLREELRRVESLDELPPDLRYALELLAAAFGTSAEAMRENIIYTSFEDELTMGFLRSVPTSNKVKPSTRLAALISEGRAVPPTRTKRNRSRDNLIPVKGSVSELVIEDRRR
jgi:hypothetical protein